MSDCTPVGLLGGTFDPIHFGHLRLAEQAREALQLPEIRFIPAGDPPHRERPEVTAGQRLCMVKLAVANNCAFIVDDIEVSAGEKSYTVLTLERLRERYGPERPLILILGADAFVGLPQWHWWRRVFDLAHVAVANRAGFGLEMTAFSSSLPAELAMLCDQRLKSDVSELRSSAAGHIVTFAMTPLMISASLVRSLLRTQRSARYLLPASVLDYIESNHLYR